MASRKLVARSETSRRSARRGPGGTVLRPQAPGGLNHERPGPRTGPDPASHGREITVNFLGTFSQIPAATRENPCNARLEGRRDGNTCRKDSCRPSWPRSGDGSARACQRRGRLCPRAGTRRAGRPPSSSSADGCSRRPRAPARARHAPPWRPPGARRAAGQVAPAKRLTSTRECWARSFEPSSRAVSIVACCSSFVNSACACWPARRPGRRRRPRAARGPPAPLARRPIARPRTSRTRALADAGSPTASTRSRSRGRRCARAWTSLPAAQLQGTELDLRLLVDQRERLVRRRVALNNTLARTQTAGRLAVLGQLGPARRAAARSRRADDARPHRP